ncbi:MAG: CsbD family protein [Opitutales bacterium]|nr:CsbD family protein [Opitutales bacterium]
MAQVLQVRRRRTHDHSGPRVVPISLHKDLHMNNWKTKGNWNIVKGRLKQAYGSLTDDDLKQIEGDAQEAVGVIQKRTGESREAIEKRLDKISSES